MSSTPSTLVQAVRFFTRERAHEYVQAIKWPNGPVCPRCGSKSIGHITSRARYQCRSCRKQFSLTTDTIFESTHLKLDQWMVAIWMLTNCRNGVSSCEIARTIGCKQQSAWHLLHRARHILQQDTSEQMGQNYGVVETDCTFVGGAMANMHAERKERARQSPRPYDKTIVHAIKERRTGMVRATVVPVVEPMEFVNDDIRKNVDKTARVYTDSAQSYAWLMGEGFRHAAVNHGKHEYVRGPVHVNGCENYFNCLRRAIGGSYVNVSHGHLHAYVQEQEYRFNIRKLDEWARFESAMRLILDKRLTYSELTGGAVR